MQELIENLLLIVVAILAIGFILFGQNSQSYMTKKQKIMLWRIAFATIFLLGLQSIGSSFFNKLGDYGRWIRLALYLCDYLIIGYDILKKAFRGICNRQIFDENFLMAVATLGALTLAIYDNGEYLEVIAVMLFYQVGEWFQSYAVGKSRRNISELMDIRPDYANIEKEGKLEKIDPNEVEVGTVIVVNPGEKVPIDGKVIDGSSSLNTSALTGESIPCEVSVGDDIISGSINLTGVIKIQTSKEFSESTVSKILDLVENASSRKSQSENFISRFAKIYTPFVCYAALAIAIIPPLTNIFINNMASDFKTWIYRALTFLVASCPCALVISIPLSFFAGIGGASRAGILIKGSNYLELLSKIKILVFDKTGTLTKGNFEVNAVHHNIIDEEKLIEYAALAESASSHPISKSLKKAYGKDIDINRVHDVKEYSGKGIVAKVDKDIIAAGNDKLMEFMNVKYINCHEAGTIIHIAINNIYAGHIVICDIIKDSSAVAINELKKIGIQKLVMLTGDSRKVAEQVGNTLKINEIYSNLLPSDKVSKVEELLAQKNENEKLAFVGDGINDAPVLSRADLGIAMGAMGSDAAIEAADVVLMNDDPIQIVKAIKISKKCLRIVYENIVLSIAVKLICLLLVAVGFANMWLAIFADVGVMIIAILNAVRALSVKNL